MLSKKLIVALLIGTLLLPLCSTGQPEKDWDNTFGGVKDDCGISIQKAGTGYIIAGYTIDDGNRDVYLVKTHSDGEKDWDKTFGEAGDDVGWAVLKIKDGYVITGSTESYGSQGKDLLLMKTDLDGDEVWTKHFGGPGDQWGTDLIETTDGYVIAGMSESPDSNTVNGYVIKVDLDGKSEWDFQFGGSKCDSFNSVQNADEGYILVGTTESYGSGGKDVWLVKIDSDGGETWDKQFGGTGDEFGNSLVKVKDGYVIAGVTESSGNRDLWLIKTDLDGNQKWETTFGGSGDDGGWELLEDGGYLVAGYTESEGNGDQDMWLVKVDSEGEEVWKQTFGDSGFDLCRSFVKVSTGVYAMIGWTESKGSGGKDVWLVKTKKY